MLRGGAGCMCSKWLMIFAPPAGLADLKQSIQGSFKALIAAFVVCAGKCKALRQYTPLGVHGTSLEPPTAASLVEVPLCHSEPSHRRQALVGKCWAPEMGPGQSAGLKLCSAMSSSSAQ